MKLRRLTLLRPNMGNYRSSDALPPLAMGILAARTPKDIEICFFDDRIETTPEEDSPDLVAMSVETFTARRAYELAAGYKARGIPVVMGGYHPSFLPDETLEHADAIVIGDAEGSWETLLADFQRDNLQRVYRGNNALPLDNVIIDRTIFADKHYAPVEPVQFGRGCRFACDFCSIHTFYKNGMRARPTEQVIEEMQRLNRSRLFFFVDDNLFGSPEQLRTLCDAVAPLGIRWSCQISIDVVKNEKLLDAMAAAGCMFVLIGFESLSTNNLRQMAKPWNRSAGDYRDVARNIHARGIAIYGTFVFGYDSDTLDDIQRSLDFAQEAHLEIANFNPLTPTPASPLYGRLLSEGRMISPQWWLDPDYRYGDPIFRPALIDPYVFTQACFEAKRTFYSWPSILRRILGSDAGLNWFRTSTVLLANHISRREVIRKQHRKLGA
jgi:Fe-S oxidoreductase